MAKFYQVKKVINGVEYTAQFNGISSALKAIDGSNINVDGATAVSVEKLSKYIFDNVIVNPTGLTADSFETMDEFNDVVAFGREVMQGNFRNKTDEEPAPKESKK